MFAPVLTSIIDSYGHIGRPSFEHSAETLLYAVDSVDPSLDEFFGRAVSDSRSHELFTGTLVIE